MDIQIQNEGNIFLFRPISEAGKAWIDENLLLLDIQRFGQSTAVVEHRYAGDIANAILEAGLSIG